MDRKRIRLILGVLLFIALWVLTIQLVANQVAEAQPSNTMVFVNPQPAPLAEVLADSVPDSIELEFPSSAELGEDGLCIVFVEPIGKPATNDEPPRSWCGKQNAMPDWLEKELELAVTVWKLYSGTNRTGNQLWGVTHYTLGCADGSSFGDPNLAAVGWGNLASSGEGLTGCNKLKIYDIPSGALIYCVPYCASLGPMNNAGDGVQANKS